ncbi:MAG: DUF2252 family protein [Deltaproteobacteria bacterium]
MRIAAATLLVALGCASTPDRGACPSDDAAPTTNPFLLADDSPYRTDPVLRAKVEKSAHRFFRAGNDAFTREVCRAFTEVRATIPIVTLHGDAHLEQIATRDDRVGLVDFDDSVSGPSVIDVVRFGVSVALVADARGWPRRDAVRAFLDSYIAALSEAPAPPMPPAIAALNAAPRPSPAEFLASADALMVLGTPPDKVQESIDTWERYTKLMVRMHPEHDASFYRVKRKGRPRSVGVGSATTKRVFRRIEGPTPADDDDLILEAKEITERGAFPCTQGRGGLSIRIIMSALQFGGDDPFVAIIPRDPSEPIDDDPWWVQSWSPRYAELDVGTAFSRKQDLSDVASFAAWQLAKGHTSFLPRPYDVQLRLLAYNAAIEHRARIEALIERLADQIEEAYAALVATR